MSNNQRVLLPGASVGVIGGGQLGRYFVLEARRLGYVTWVLDSSENAPAVQVAEHKLIAAYDDAESLQTLADACDAVTIEFENVPAESLDQISGSTRVAPDKAAVEIAQDRHAEKQTARHFGLTTAPYALIESVDDIDAAAADVAFPAILKTSRLGYDGKGQQNCNSVDDVRAAFEEVDSVPCVLEQRIDLHCELSVVLARGADGQIACFPVAENVHANGILDTTRVPSSEPTSLLREAQQLASELANGLSYEGVLAVEFFVDRNRQVLFNEMAPRPHNSGHYTLDATITSQFEQQLRVLCNLPLGPVDLLSPVCMLNVLGDSWPDDGSPNWDAVLAEPGAHLHLYGKGEARPGRKMGHINCLAADAPTALALAHRLKSQLAH